MRGWGVSEARDAYGCQLLGGDFRLFVNQLRSTPILLGIILLILQHESGGPRLDQPDPPRASTP